MDSRFILFIFAFLLVGGSCGTRPEQIHLALTDTKDQMSVSWVTVDSTATSSVMYWKLGESNNITTTGTSSVYTLMDDYTSPFIHVVHLTGLSFGATYEYICGDEDGGWSSAYRFFSEDNSEVSAENPLVFASIADQGTSPNSTKVTDALFSYHSEVNAFDFLYLAGDISYANGFQFFWDMYANMIQPIAATAPWMVGPGNHEIFWLFKPYLARFDMPQELWYSFNYRNVHFISLNSEELEFWHFLDQYTWLEADLASVNRTETPWIVAGFHTPWYCSNTHHNLSGDDMRESFEDTFYKYGVDLVLMGHVHAYERTTPMYNWAVDPNGPVYIVNGVAGTEEGLYDTWDQPSPDWSAHRAAEWGFGVMEVHNSTHMFWQYIEADGLVVNDATWITRNQ